MSRRLDRSSGRQFSANETLPYIVGPEDSPIELRGLEIRVVVAGLFAETTQILTLFNPGQRPLEGNLCFPLPDRAVVCGYGLDVDGVLVDGVVVGKEEARRILDTEIRKGVDPGLVEKVQGNVYRTRVYPLPPGGSRTVKIVYVSDLTVEGNEAAYHLPIGHAEGVDEVSLKIEIAQTPVTPAVVGGLGNLTLTEMRSVWTAEATLGTGMPAEDLQIRLPGLPDHLTSIEQCGDESFFCVSSRNGAPDGDSAKWEPRRIAVLWDSSGSRRESARDLELLQHLASQWPRVIFDVSVVRNVVEDGVVSFSVADGETDKLAEYLGSLPRDGATNLASVDFGNPPHAEDEAWLVFSDGMGTLGSGLPATSSLRVFTVSSQADCDAAYLTVLAERSGGRHFNLLRTSAADVALSLGDWTDALRIERTAGCEDVHVFSSQGRLTVVGRLTESMASVFLVGPGAPDDQLTVTQGTASEGHNIARAWAGRQAELEGLVGDRPESLVELGRKYALVTPGTSLLVLETLEQYVEHDVEPPASLARMREEFNERRREAQADQKEDEKNQLDRVHSMWEQRIDWWETDFHLQRETEAQKKVAEFSSQARVARATMASPPPAMASPPSPMAPMAPMEDIEGADEFEESMMSPEPSIGGGAGRSRGVGGAAAKKPQEGGRASAVIQIKAWNPDTPYLRSMDAASAGDAYAAYLEARDEYAASPSFYLDCADFLLKQQQQNLGLRVLSNLLELALGDPALLRMYAWRMQQAEQLDEAIEVFEGVRQQRDDEPQSHRDLALALELRWQRDGEAADAIRAMELLYAVVKRTWDRFPEIEIIALMELNRLIRLATIAGVSVPEEIDPRFVRLLDLDVRISMSWDADLTDVDLHVFEPSGDHAYYGHNQTAVGGLVSRDFTQGYGPEEYVLRKSDAGSYTIKAHYYGSHQQTIAGGCTVIVTVFTNYARDNEEKQVLTLRLDKPSDQVVVGSITVAGSGTDAGGVAGSEASWLPLFRSLKQGMTVDEIVAVVGQPAELRGSEETTLVFHPRGDVEIHVIVSPRLESVRRIMEGAVLDLV